MSTNTNYQNGPYCKRHQVYHGRQASRVLHCWKQQTSPSEHSPLPWIADGSYQHDREGVQIWSGDQIVADVIPDQHGRHKANATVIARAVNSHAALIAVVRDHADKIRNEIHSKTCGALRGQMCTTPSRCLRINEALRTAGEEI